MSKKKIIDVMLLALSVLPMMTKTVQETDKAPETYAPIHNPDNRVLQNAKAFAIAIPRFLLT